MTGPDGSHVQGSKYAADRRRFNRGGWYPRYRGTGRGGRPRQVANLSLMQIYLVLQIVFLA